MLFPPGPLSLLSLCLECSLPFFEVGSFFHNLKLNWTFFRGPAQFVGVSVFVFLFAVGFSSSLCMAHELKMVFVFLTNDWKKKSKIIIKRNRKVYKFKFHVRIS